MNESVLLALGLSFLAGAATMLGGALAFIIKKENLAALAIGLGFSAGVMIYVSFMELLPQARKALQDFYGVYSGEWKAIGLFFAGILLAWGIDWALPSHHVEVHTLDASNKLKRLGLFTALALAVHNFPEGLVTFVAALKSTTLGSSVALAVAIHNIPEGVAVALPVFHATGSRSKAFVYSTLSGLAEPVGALVGFLVLRHFLNEAVFGFLFAVIAGIMVYIALDELLPTAHEYGEGHFVIWGVIGGMMIMAVSLLMF
ncbi:MAG: zinc transporter ZupT [Elusimicrobiaceae bacterium]|nr:zinc transporter ZupT [Elusimicrobiaceae bacterium]